MRTRKEIEKKSDTEGRIAWDVALCLEVLLDIRDLLAHPPIEITGKIDYKADLIRRDVM